jgi:hypothetical protein
MGKQRDRLEENIERLANDIVKSSQEMANLEEHIKGLRDDIRVGHVILNRLDKKIIEPKFWDDFCRDMHGDEICPYLLINGDKHQCTLFEQNKINGRSHRLNDCFEFFGR